MSKHCYLINGESLFCCYDDGTYDRVATDLSRTTKMAAMDHRLFMMWRDFLKEVGPATGKETTISRGWPGEQFELAASGGKLLVSSGAKVWEAMLDGDYRLINTDYGEIDHLCGTEGRFFCVEDARLREIDLAGGDWRTLGTGWHSLIGFTVVAGVGYILENDGELYRLDLDSGEYSRMCGGFYGATAVIAGEEAVFILDKDVLYCVGFDGEYAMASSGWYKVTAWGGQG